MISCKSESIFLYVVDKFFWVPNQAFRTIHYNKRKMIHKHHFIHTPHYTPYVLEIFW